MNAAAVIAQQLGGIGRLTAMVGAHSFAHSNDGNTLVFKFRGCRKINCLRITLTPADLYDVEFVKVYSINRKTFEIRQPETVAAFDGIYCDQLMDLFEDQTGLYLTLAPRA